MIAIADIAGQYDALMRLVSKFPGRDFILLGDLVDRGPKSKQVIEWAMKTPNVRTLMGNHEHLFIDWWLTMIDPDYQSVYSNGDWFSNGGLATLRSYVDSSVPMTQLELARSLPIEHLQWLEKLPVCYSTEHFFFSHAPWLPGGKGLDTIWNRLSPEPMDGVLQLFGHNSHWGLKTFETKWAEHDDVFAICLDQSRREVLTAYDCHHHKITEEPYREPLSTDRGEYH